MQRAHDEYEVLHCSAYKCELQQVASVVSQKYIGADLAGGFEHVGQTSPQQSAPLMAKHIDSEGSICQLVNLFDTESQQDWHEGVTSQYEQRERGQCTMVVAEIHQVISQGES